RDQLLRALPDRGPRARRPRALAPAEEELAALDRRAGVALRSRELQGGRGPGDLVIVEPGHERRLDDLEIRGDVEVARRVQAVVADAQRLPVAVHARRV